MAIFKEYFQKFMANFVDNLIVYSNKYEHLQCLWLVPTRCWEKKVCLNPLRCLFDVDKGEDLGSMVTSKGIKITNTKLIDILEAKPLRNANEVASFLGFIIFYKRFIDRIAQLVAPLYALNKKDAKFKWDLKC